MTERPAPSRAGAALSVRVVDGACIVFALWTLCCHATVVAGGSLHDLLLLFTAVAVAAGGAWVWRARRGDAPAPEPPAEPPAPEGARRLALRAGAGAGAVAAAWWLRTDALALWWAALLLLGLGALVSGLRAAPRREPAARGARLEAGLWALALACALLALVAHRIDIDDAFYVNLAVAAADAPGERLLHADTLHGVAGLPIHLPVYRLHSYEVWNGALSLLTGLPAIACFHWLSAGLAALLVPLAFARVARALAPRHWLWVVAAVVWVLVAAGETHRWYGNFAFVRMWQGKSILLFVFLPLVQAYALDFAARPRTAAFVRLAAAQIAAVGCSSSALWAGPATALATLACALPLGRRGLRVLALGGLASLYVLGAGVALKTAMDADRDARSTEIGEAVRARSRERLARDHAPGVQLERSLAHVTGTGALRVAALAAVMGAWACLPVGLARRFAVGVPLAMLLVVLDPYLSRFTAANLTGASTWRGLWGLPIPLLLALALCAPIGSWRARPALARAAGLLLLLGFAAVPATGGLDPENRVHLAWPPRLKVPATEYRWAEALNAAAGEGAVVVAPDAVSVWLPTLHQRAFPLVVRPLYLRRYGRELGREDLVWRLLLTRYVEGEAGHPDAALLFRNGLERFSVSAVCLRNSSQAAEARAILRRAGFRRSLRSVDYEIWVRS